ncbi:hypothetical protein GCM10009092_30620 [Bowmanella denitrificans]|uniref:PEP-CTERM protein-sorting domain-containing protein n=2 Tax=Bowmanella denitrificans TaxID=366582 RepID=A0ABN0XHC0_9ALTE
MFMKVFALTLALFSLSSQAALIRADFRTESNLPDYGSGQPLVYQSLNQTVGAGYELDSADFVQNPDGWYGGVVWVDYDPASAIITLWSQDYWDFQTFDVWISNIQFDVAGETIANVVLLSDNLIEEAIAPVVSITSNSLHIAYDYRPDTFLFSGGMAKFKMESREGDITQPLVNVPEPLTALIMLVGLLVIGRQQYGIK